MSKVVTAAAAAELDRQLRSPNGRYEIGQTMLEPFKEGRDYISVGRKVLAVHHLEPGAPAWYDIDPQFSATVIGSLGGAPRVLDGSQYQRVELTHFPIVVLVRIGVEQPAIRRFDVLDREQVRAQAEMAEVEDTEIFAAIRAGATSGSGVSNGVSSNTIVTGSFSLDNLALLYSYVEDAADSNVENILMRATQYRSIRTLTGTTFDPVTRRELLKTGYMGDLWNSQIRISKKMASSEILACASPEYLGVLSVRIDLSQMDAPLGELLQYGWVLYSFVNPAVLCNVGAAKYTVS
jgi:hypothetical protein